MRILRFTVTALLAGSLLPAVAFAGVYLESVDKELDDSKSATTSKMWVDGGRMRTERAGHDGDLDVVIFKSQAMYTLEPKSKSYRVLDKAAADRMGAQVANAKKQMEAKLAAMPPDQRKKMEEMLAKMGQGGAGLPGSPQAPKRTLRKTSRTETVAGVNCTIWEALEGGKKDEELCAAAPSSLPGGDEVMKAFKEIATMLTSLTASLGAANSGNQPWRDMETLKGVPILTREFDDAGKAESETRLTVARKEPVPAASFEVPAGYTEKKMEFGRPASGGADD